MAEFKIPKYKYKGDPISLDECYKELSHLTYQFPVEIMYQGFQTKLEGDIMDVIHSYGVSVNKDELIKALKYDRNQYEKGFIEGYKHDTSTIKREVAREIFENITDFILTCIENDEKVFNSGEDEYYDGRFMGFKIIEEHLVELKKKYTESGNEDD